MPVRDDGKCAARTAPHLASWFRLALLVSVSPFAIGVHEAAAATAAPASASTTANLPVAIDLTNDITTLGGYTPIVTVSTAPAHGSTSVAGEVVTYTPTAGFTGTDTFVYTVLGDAVPASATVTVSVNTATLDPSVFGMIGALQQSTLLSAFAQVDNFNRHLENLRDELRHGKQLGISINGQPLSASSASLGGIASMFSSPSREFASDATRSGPRPQTAQAAPADASDAVPIELPDRIGLFLNGNLSLRQITGTNGVPDASPRTTSVSGGIDYRLNAGTIIGIGAGYTGNTTDIGGGSKSTSDAFNITAYGTTRPIDPVYIDAQASYHHISFNTLRDVAGTAFLRGSPDGNVFSASLTGGYEFEAGPYTFGPYLRADGAHGTIDAFTEAGPSAFAVSVGGQTVDSAHGVLGFRGDRAISTDYGIVSPHIRAEYLHEFVGGSSANVAFANGAASGFQVAGYPVSRNYLMLGGGVSFLTVSALSVFIDYDALVGYTNQTSHSITAGASIRF